MKKIIAVSFIFIFILTMCSCKETSDKEKIISVNYNTKIYEKLFTIPFDYQLTETMKENGFLSVKKKANGLAEFEIKQEDYDTYISKLCASRKEIFDEDNTKYRPYVKSVSYNDDLTEITIAVSRSDYDSRSTENGSGYMMIRTCISGCVNNVAVYHSFSTGDFKECEIKVVDSETHEVLETVYSPKRLLEN